MLSSDDCQRHHDLAISLNCAADCSHCTCSLDCCGGLLAAGGKDGWASVWGMNGAAVRNLLFHLLDSV